MNYVIDPLNRITQVDKKQLYGSKTIVNTHFNVVYSLPNFTSMLVTDTPLYDKNSKLIPLAFVGLPKS